MMMIEGHLESPKHLIHHDNSPHHLPHHVVWADHDLRAGRVVQVDVFPPTDHSY